MNGGKNLDKDEAFRIIQAACHKIRDAGGNFEDFTHALGVSLEGCKYALQMVNGKEKGAEKFERICMDARFEGEQVAKRCFNDHKRTETDY